MMPNSKCILCGLELINPPYPRKTFHEKSICHNCLTSINGSELISD